MNRTEQLRDLVSRLTEYQNYVKDDDYIPSELNRLVLIIKGRIYDLEEAND